MMSQPFCGAGISRGEAVGMAFQINPGLTSPLSVYVSGGGVGAVLCARVELNAGSAIRDGSVGSSMRCGLLIPNRQDIMQMGISDILGIPEQATKDTIQCPGGYPMWLLVLFVVIVVSDRLAPVRMSQTTAGSSRCGVCPPPTIITAVAKAPIAIRDLQGVVFWYR